MRTTIRKVIATLLVVTTASMGPTPAAWAEAIGTERALAERERILVVLDRADVRSALAARGVSAAEAKARVAALTDAEATELAQRIDAAPAGGRNPLAILVVPFYVLYGAVYLVALLIGGLASLASKA